MIYIIMSIYAGTVPINGTTGPEMVYTITYTVTSYYVRTRQPMLSKQCS